MHVVVYLCFLLSGATGLVFENLWVRQLTLVFGSTSLAVSSVLTAYMGGLALGSWLFGRWADDVRSPLKTYAVMEIGVGGLALLVPLVIQNLYPSVNAWLWSTFEPGYFAFSFLRFFFSVALLILPTTLMGGTLPILTRALVRTDQEMEGIGSRVGWLYTANTTGAVLGTFACGFLLMPVIGLAMTNLSAACVNVLVIGVPLLLAAPLLSKRLGEMRVLATELASQATDDREPEDVVEPPGRTARIVVLVGFGLSGLASMNYQVIWSRVLSMVIGSSVYAFAIILMAFLVGIAGGASLASALLRKRSRADLVFWLGIVHLVIATTAVVDYFFVDHYPYVFARLVTSIEHFYEHVGLIQFMMFSIAGMAIIPVTLGMGATMPLTVAALTPERERVSRDVGNIYAINTIGAIIGSFASAFILVPGFSRIGGGYGLQWAYLLSVTLNLGLFVALVAVSRAGKRIRTAAMASPAVLAVLVAVVVWTGSMWDPARITIGAFRVSLADDVLDEESWGEPEIIYYFDGVSTTVSVERWGQHLAMKNNGKVEASSGDDMVTQIMVSAYPLIFHRDAGERELRTAIIGFGSGVTVGAALQFPLSELHVVELEPAVVESSRYFEEHNFMTYGVDGWPWVMEPGLEVISNDGRNFLVSGARSYDVIVSEPSNPWITGVSNLFTVDHYEAATRSLAPGGIYCQWVQLYEMSLGNIKTLFRTFAEVFPYVVVFAADPLSSDTIMLGSFEPIRFDLERVRKLWQDEQVRRALDVAGVEEPHELMGRIIFASREEILEYTTDARLNTDDNAVIEFAAPRDLIGYEKHELAAGELYKEDWPFGNLDHILVSYGEGEDAAGDYAELALALASSGRYRLAGHMLTRSGTAGRSEMGDLAVLVLANLTSDENDPDVVFDPPVPGPAMDDRTLRQFWDAYDESMNLLMEGDAVLSLEALLAIPEIPRRNSGPGMLFLEAYLLYYNGEYWDSISLLEDLKNRPDGFAQHTPEVYYYLAKAHDRSYNYRSAVTEMRGFVLLKLAERLREKAGTGDGPGQDSNQERGTAPDGGEDEDQGQEQGEGEDQGEDQGQGQG